MTHLVNTAPSNDRKDLPKSQRLTRCGKILHRKWVVENPPAACQECWPTMAGMLKQLAALPAEIRKLGKALAVARG